ncbi:hypothetical protein Aoki45_09230 [Algoriphagus sp. oki45]|uniref:hypothetical protein n=1 Tax=Algoriphagus sp. oki45 TaxID=3067294 RepID=UPI0027F434B6|nr:hypothetical protein Aoki45_09230 [Algoriphagus sp. oki45]
MRQLILLCFLGLFTHFAFCQTDPLTQSYGSRSQGMGQLRLFTRDAWTFFNNVGNLDRLEESELVAGYDSRFGLKELSTYSLAGGIKSKVGTFGLGVSSFGDQFFNQQILGIGFSNTLGIVSLGVKLDWFQTQIEGFGSSHSFLISLGGVAELGPKTFLGAYFSNLNQAKYSKNSEQLLPTLIQMGISYLASTNLSLSAEIEKEVETNPIFRAGLEYKLQEWIYLRTGVSSNPSRISFGLGLRKDRFGFDYAFGENTALGVSHHLSLGFKVGK